MEIVTYSPSYQSSWDQYVAGHPRATYCHLIGWQKVIKRTYGHADHYLLAEEKGRIVGVLPLFRLKSLLFGDSLISMPFLDYGGLLSDDDEAGKNLLMAAIDLAHRLRVDGIELRHVESPQWLEGFNQNKNDNQSNTTGRANVVIQDRSLAKIRMLLQLPENSEYLMKSFKSKLRSQITKPLKEGCSVTFGGTELLDDFYEVFSINMRDLGSPVHEKKLFRNLFDEFPDKSKIFLVSKDKQCVAVSIVIGFKGVLENPWASSLRKHRQLGTNMLLYWAMLQYACDNGFRYFDFGRSTPGEGTFKFKEQWGPVAQNLQWTYLSLDGREGGDGSSQKVKFQRMVDCWKRLPVPLTRIIGPRLRKYIGL
jgi:FemAB-related protein (PEP-CTERM system-associated)